MAPRPDRDRVKLPSEQLEAIAWTAAEAVVAQATAKMISGLSTPVEVGGAPGKAIHELPDAIKAVVDGIGEYTREHAGNQSGDGVSGAAFVAAAGVSGEAMEALLEIAITAGTPILHTAGDAVQGVGEVGGHLAMAVSALEGDRIGEALGHMFDAATTTLETAGQLVKNMPDPDNVRDALVFVGEVIEGGVEVTDALIDGIFEVSEAIYDDITAPEVNLVDNVRDMVFVEPASVATPLEPAQESYPGEVDDSAKESPEPGFEEPVCYPDDGYDDVSYPTSDATETSDSTGDGDG
jgi:hypothetical protein